MLYIESFKGNTLDILKGLMAIPDLNMLDLAGGTALSLKYGHRVSVDLDLFSSRDFDNKTVIRAIKSRYPSYQVQNPNRSEEHTSELQSQ